ncbi:MAG: hypothetical protein SFU25_04955 [Candidatus Caenarcaniphilales bacterium]|nr:hypothetical protein [Candidatus Caenarcaniphilales bacterium]
MKKVSGKFCFFALLFFCVGILASNVSWKAFSQGIVDDQGFQRSINATNINPAPDNLNQSTHIPGLGWGGIPFSESVFQEIPSEKCSGETVAEIIAEYELSKKIYLLKTSKGLVVAGLEQTLKDIETGQHRKKMCPVAVGMKLNGEIDCKGMRVIKEEPFKGCAYEAKVYAHSLPEGQAFNMVYSKLKGQFMEFKKECVLPPKPKSLGDSMIKF